MQVALYSITIFASAWLLFVVQPLAGRALLPRLGGVPGAWTACLLFFQTALLVGYGYVWASARFPLQLRAVVHVVVLGVIAFAIPAFSLGEPIAISPVHSPSLYALVFLTRSIGAPFVLLAATSPLLQHWFSGSRPGARPYFLYAASNIGSLGALAGYPFVIEPLLALPDQEQMFRVGFAVVVALIAICALFVLRLHSPGSNLVPTSSRARVPSSRRARWVALALVPAMLLAGATTHLSTDLAPVPLLWVVPLAIYLLSFVLAFGRRIGPPPTWLARAACLIAVVLVFAVASHANEPAVLLVVLHLAFLGIASWVAHRRLADDAPDPVHLPEFYTWIALGGVLGTLASATIAPAVLPDLWEYPAAIAFATMARPIGGVVREDGPWRNDLGHALAVGVVPLVLGWGIPPITMGPVQLSSVLMFGPSAVYAYRWMPLRRRFALCLLALIVASAIASRGDQLFSTRSFFGVLRVVDHGDDRYLMHGTTLHGIQRLSERDRCTPLAYYSEDGPLGDVFRAHRARGRGGRTVAIGLGTGAVACYAVRGEPWRFLEINPDVARIAGEPRWFTYLGQSPSRDVRVDLRDGRIGIGEERNAGIALLVVDAFNSDSVPVHLLTREAIRLDLEKVQRGGWIAVHLSNRALDLVRVLSDVVTAEGLAARVAIARDRATWAVLAQSEADLEALDPRAWEPLPRGNPARAWSDAHASIWSALRPR